MAVWERGEDPFADDYPSEKWLHPAFERRVERWPWPEAGCLSSEETELVFRELVASYYPARKKDA